MCVCVCVCAIKKPQATSIARAHGFNKAKVNEFFQMYRSVLETAQYTPSRVWNMDEIGITNVQRPGKLVATKGARHVAKVTSGERGTTVRVVCAINAAGGYLPSMFIFPRKRMVAALMNGATPESVDYSSPNGWIGADLFVKWLEHFAASTNACKENQQIIIMDGHHSHNTFGCDNLREIQRHTAARSATSVHTQDAAARHNVLQMTEDRVQQRSRQLDGHQSRSTNDVL